MFRTAALLLTALALAGTSNAADRTCPIPTCDPRLIGVRALHATVATTPIAIDGRLDEPEWDEAPRAADFMQARPVPGAAATLHTEAQVLVDGSALYVGVRMEDPDPRAIVAPFLRRDDEGQSDWVFVEVDSRRDRRSAYSFGLNPRGVQVDGVFIDDSAYDVEWNGIWEGAARIDARGWTAEFRIPLSQIAFSPVADGGDTTWGFNVYRYSPARGEASNWSPRFTGLPGVVSQFNDLHVAVAHAPRRLEVAPFVAPRIEHGSTSGAAVNGGADFSVGLGPSFALTGAALPDFGQVEADPSQINLTAFELFQSERRPFFVEGASAFAFNAGTGFVTRGNSFGEETPFYSRRIGRDGARVLGALKLSGRTRDGWSVGALAAATDADGTGRSASTTAIVSASRSLRTGESALGAIAVVRGAAAVYGADARHRFARQQYELTGWALASRMGEAVAADSGAAGQAKLAKVTGAWVWSVTGEAISRHFDMNATGFQRNADWLLLKSDWRYQRQREGHVVRRWTIGSDSVGLGWSTGGEPRARTVDAFVRADLRSYWSASLSWTRDLPALSFEWLRGGPPLRLPSRDTWRITLGSDSRKRSSIAFNSAVAREPANGSAAIAVDPQITWRASDRIIGSIAPSYRRDIVGWQFVDAAANDRLRPIVARLQQDTLSVIVRADVVFDARTIVQLYLQPFTTDGRYGSFQRLADPRADSPTARFAPLEDALPFAIPDPTRTSLNATLVFRWEYRPASFVTAVWTHQNDDAVPAGSRADVVLLKTSLRLGR